jgi:transcriptional regulator with XRE-family HTH domain
MPRRRWTDFPAGLRQVRVSSGLTQSDLAEMLNVDQATVSRWERGAQMPDADMQARLRDILFRGRAISDSRLTHLVRTAHNLMGLIGSDGKFVALSEMTRAILPENVAVLADVMTPSIQEVWNTAVAAGFFRGEIASIQFAVEARRRDGTVFYVEGSSHPAPLTDGSVLMLAEGREIAPEMYERLRALGLRITPLEEIL